MSLRISILGSYGTGNRGDHAILLQLLRFLESKTRESRYTILCRDEDRLSSRLRVDFPEGFKRVRVLRSSFRKRPLSLLFAALRCDLFILGGGGLLWGKGRGNLAYWLRLPRLALFARRKLAFYAPGILNIEGRRARRLLSSVARRAAFLSVRDYDGQEELLRCGIPESDILLGADPAFLYPPAEKEQSRAIQEARGLAGRRCIGLSARDWRGRLSAGLFSRLISRLLEDEDASLLFFALKTGGKPGDTDRDDIAVLQALLLTLPDELHQRIHLVGEGESVENIIALMGACEFLLGMRLHALIFASLAGTPFGALPYDRKVEAFMEMLGLQDSLLLPDEFGQVEAMDALVSRLRDARKRGGEDGPREIRIAAAQLSVRAQDMHRKLGEFLEVSFPDSVRRGDS
ncbi:MAG: polysaccharide pyruvyl transferase family protein [Candidatus Krumholzibacteria bacterium]|jgi:polysaccharide pyruvyl transferase WcaK-like protein|nr:polysaccharide pyruvyl transferase family protein [Candidatus Krumholzibacteria bacterium]MDP6668400.1 polysaccharide pyruvyl transferase family protein [Candidatus Krumholzibacteria bacterium]MDP6797969.1 polysaccharide pyruvyl transferase family protein [Candidatus Krumholzibacteria bacterium]MDP7021876.1 polysaccharide pyruvyl transferase family protein [Candidatus Krumholzibacteria bacterium]